MKGNEAIAEAAVQAGCRFYAGYPITPQNEIPEYLLAHGRSQRRVHSGRERTCGNQHGLWSGCVRFPGDDLLKQSRHQPETGGHLVSCRSTTAALIVNVQRGGPGLGNIAASQADYFQAVKGGGHGDYRLLVFAPFSVQELWDFTMIAFDKADEYRIPAMILTDGVLAQMMEPMIKTPYVRPDLPPKTWALGGCAGRDPNVVRTLYMGHGDLAERNRFCRKPTPPSVSGKHAASHTIPTTPNWSLSRMALPPVSRSMPSTVCASSGSVSDSCGHRRSGHSLSVRLASLPNWQTSGNGGTECRSNGRRCPACCKRKDRRGLIGRPGAYC